MRCAVLLSLGLVAAAQNAAVTNCLINADCSAFGDAAATCVSGACTCSAAGTGPLCTARNAPQPEVSFVLSYTTDIEVCGNFIRNNSAMTVTAAIISDLADVQVQAVSTHSCTNSTYGIALHTNATADGSPTLLQRVVNTANTAVGRTEHAANLALRSASVRTAFTECGQATQPEVLLVNLQNNATSRCVPRTCQSTYSLRTSETTLWRTACIWNTPAPSTSSDDDALSTAQIWTIVLAAVMVLVLVTLFVVWKKVIQTSEPAYEKEVDVKGNEPA